MPKSPKDNSTFALKSALRIKALLELEHPMVMETHAGFGKLYSRCYAHLPEGVAFEKKPAAAEAVARQRPTWAVYEADCVQALRAGVGSHLAVNFLDLNPYGENWPVLDAFLESERPKPDRLVLAVNDGLRQLLKVNGGWKVASLQDIVARMGNGCMCEKYLEVCQALVKEKADKAGYHLTRWTAYYAGTGLNMTHYAAVLDRA